MRRITSAATWSALLLLPFPAFAQAPRPPIKIGHLSTYTGVSAGPGQNLTRGLELYLAKIGNKAGGRELHLLKEDDEFKPDVGLLKARKLVERDRVDVVVGPVSSGVALAIRDFIHGQGIPLIVPVAFTRDLTAPAMASPWILRVIETSDQSNFNLGTWLFKNTPHRKLAVIGADYAAGRHAAGAFMAAFRAAGGEIVKDIYAPLGTPDFAPYVAQLGSFQADAVYAFIVGADAIRFVKTYQDYGLRGKLPIFTHLAMVDDDTLAAMGDSALGIVAVANYSATLDTPENRAFVKDYEAKYNSWPHFVAEGGYVAGQLVGAAIEDRAILAALETQRQVGLDVFTDGEYRRYSFMTDMVDAVEGFVPGTVGMEWRGPGTGTKLGFQWMVGARLRQTRQLTAYEVPFLKKYPRGPFKITIPSPNLFVFAGYKPGLTDQFYPSKSDLLHELVEIVRKEVQALVREGVPYIQVDAPNYTAYVDERLRARMRQAGIDPEQALDEAIAADKACLEGVRGEGVTLAIHLCRGNSQSHWLAEGGYDPIAEKLFNSFAVDRFLLEYDTARAGGFEPLRFVPKGKVVVLGLITSKEGRLEPQEELLRRVEEASRYVPLENLALSPQCGFASSIPGNLLSRDDQHRKMELVVATARKIWG